LANQKGASFFTILISLASSFRFGEKEALDDSCLSVSLFPLKGKEVCKNENDSCYEECSSPFRGRLGGGGRI
jgi:hypothetical protein